MTKKSSALDRTTTIVTMIAALLLCSAGCGVQGELPPDLDIGRLWLAMHFLGYQNDQQLDQLAEQIPQLAATGINVIILEVDYSFQFVSHPELRPGPSQISEPAAHRFAQVCRDHGVRLIVEFQCLGHQSWEEVTFPLLTEYPELDLTPGAFPGNQGIYCREWDPTRPEVYEIVFALIDELIDAFEVDAIHVGMDEVFLLGDPASPSTHGKDPAQLFARAVNDIHQHVVGKRGLEMLMWGDRLIDGNRYDYDEWEASMNGTAGAVDLIPKDIIICDWHYHRRRSYPSVDMFVAKGFRVLPTSWKRPRAARALLQYSLALDHPLVLGHLFTRWQRYEDPATYQPMTQSLELLQAFKVMSFPTK
jgi:hypothetical protein